MKILMGIDDSKFSGEVLQAVITQFRPEHIEVRVLHVLQSSVPAPPQMAPGYAPELGDRKRPAREWWSELRTSSVAQDSRWIPPSR